MKLSALAAQRTGGPDPEIKGITADSRAVAPGFLFAALPGVKVDGAEFIEGAVSKGAVAVLANTNARHRIPENVAAVLDDNPRQRLAQLAARHFGKQPENIVAVTGTNGKTSIASFTREIWSRLGVRAASFGTVGIVSPEGAKPLSHTTPDPIEIHRMLAELADARVDHVAFEASSHGLAQYRVDGVKLRAAGFTNLTRDHLDYHPTFEDYAQAKLRLFSEVLPPGAVAVINADSPEAERFANVARARGHKLIMTGETGADLRLVKRMPRGEGQKLIVEWKGHEHIIDLPLAGTFQASNALVAAGMVIGLGADAGDVFAALTTIRGAAGRLEKVATAPNGAPIYVDYAHTPDALETALKALRPHTEGQLWVVFGCGGDRDPGKRPMMGAAATKFADKVVVTDDNPRSEDPEKIRAAIMAAAPGAMEIGDRHQAIRAAVSGLKPNDLLIIAGKGHETGQIVGKEVRHFNDSEEARAAVAEMKAKP